MNGASCLVRDGGAQPTLQLEDLLRHGGHSKKSKQSCKFHQAALRWLVGSTQPEGEQDAARTPDEGPLPASHVRIAMQVLRNPASSQGTAFEAKCKEANLLSPVLCPLNRSSSSTYYKIIDAFASVLIDEQRALIKEDNIRCIGISQARPALPSLIVFGCCEWTGRPRVLRTDQSKDGAPGLQHQNHRHRLQGKRCKQGCKLNLSVASKHQ